MADEETEISESDLAAIEARTLVTGSQYSRPGFSKTNVALSEIDRLRNSRRADRRRRLGCLSVTDFRE